MITDQNAQTVFSERQNSALPARLEWQGTDSNNQRLESGRYTMTMHVWDAAGNQNSTAARVYLLSGGQEMIRVTEVQIDGENYLRLIASGQQIVPIERWTLTLESANESILLRKNGWELPALVALPKDLEIGNLICNVEALDKLGNASLVSKIEINTAPNRGLVAARRTSGWQTSSMKFIVHTILLLWLGLVLHGCATAPTTITIAHETCTAKSLRVAVLNFSNDSSEPRLESIAKTICLVALLEKGFQVINEAEVRNFLQKKQLFPSQLTSQGNAELYTEFASELRAQGIIKGRILAVDQLKSQGETLPVMTLQLELLNAANGELMVSSFLRRSGEDYRIALHYGVLRTSSELMKQIMAEIIESWTTIGVLNCQKNS